MPASSDPGLKLCTHILVSHSLPSSRLFFQTSVVWHLVLFLRTVHRQVPSGYQVYFTMSTLFALVLVSLAAADIIPIAPGPGDVFNAGAECTIKWTPDTSASWTNMTISK
jgi:hypothetical protein